MAKSIALILAPALAIALASCGETSAPDQAHAAPAPVSEPQPATPRFEPERIVAARAALAEEPTIKDMLVADPANRHDVDWQIGVLPDGSSRIGYAQYVCIRLAEMKVVDEYTDVRIVDIAALAANGGDFRAASLGHVRCSDGGDMGV